MVRELTVIIDEVHGWTFDETARRADLSPQTVSNLYHGVTRFPQYMTIAKIARAGGVDLKELASRFGRENIAKPRLRKVA